MSKLLDYPLKKVMFVTRSGDIFGPVPLHEFQADRVLEGFASDDLGRPIIESVAVSGEGLRMRGHSGVFRYEPYLWRKFWSRNSDLLEQTAAANPYVVLAGFASWNRDIESIQALRKIENGEIAFEDVRESSPHLFEHPAIQAELARRFAADDLPKRRPGKRARVDYSVLALYGWASWYYASGAESWESACAEAINQHPEHVPPNWEDPVEALKKRARNIDRSRYSLASLRSKDV